MDLWDETNWYAVQSRAQQENLAAAGLANLDIEVFLPRIKRDQCVCGVTRSVSKPLFAGYFFARFCPLTLFGAVRYARGVLRVVSTSQGPIPLGHEIIASIKERVHEDGFVRLEPKPLLSGDKVTIQQGPLTGWLGEVEREWDDGKRVSILLEAIHKARLLVDRRLLVAAEVS